MRNERTTSQLKDGFLKSTTFELCIEVVFNVASILLGFSAGVFIGVLL
jgi:hypothetical protein